MSLLRFAARSMLASYFVVNGTKSITNPEPLVSDAEPLVKNFVPMVKQAAPAQVATFIPTDTKSLIRLNGAAQVVGGLAMATGIARRLGALTLSGAMLPHVLAVNPFKGANAAEKEENRKHSLRNIALLGGVLLAAQDLEGRPSLGWRANNTKQSLFKAGEKTAKQVKRDAKRTQKDAEKAAKQLQKEFGKQAKKAGKTLGDVLPG